MEMISPVNQNQTIMMLSFQEVSRKLQGQITELSDADIQ